MLIREHEIDVDYEEELEPYLDQFPQNRMRGHKLQSCSPFRSEAHPSFAVNLESGVFIDSGSADEEWRKGNFTKLLAYLQGVSYEEAEDYLIQKYKTIYAEVDSYKLNVQLYTPDTLKVFSKEELEPFMYSNPYLTNRGITEKVQKAFRIGYDSKSNAVVFVWTDKDGQAINLKFRAIESKKFWYRSAGQPIKQHIYGLHFVHRMNLKEVYVVESETDALYLWSHGFAAIALGSASLSTKQEELILNSPIETLVLAFDNDTAGDRCKEDVKKRLIGKVKLKVMPIPAGCKDVNDIKKKALETATQQAYEVVPKFL